MKASSIRTCRRGAIGRRFGLLFALLAVAAGLGSPPAAAQEVPIRIAVVDLDFVVAQSPAGRALQEKLATFSDEVNGEVQNRREAANGIRQRLADGANSLSAEKLSELQQDFEDAQIAIKRFQDDKQREGQKMQAEGLRGIEQQLQPVFEQVRDERGFDLILNNVPGVVVMAGPRVDITQLVIDKLNAAAAESSG